MQQVVDPGPLDLGPLDLDPWKGGRRELAIGKLVFVFRRSGSDPIRCWAKRRMWRVCVCGEVDVQ